MMMYAAQFLMQMTGANTAVRNAPAVSAGKNPAQDTSPSFQTLLQQRQDQSAQGGTDTGNGRTSSQLPAEDTLPQENGAKDSQTISMDLAALGAALLANGTCQIQPEVCETVQPQETVQPVSAEPVLPGEAGTVNTPSALMPDQTAMPEMAQQSPAAEQDTPVTELPSLPAQMQVPDGPVQEKVSVATQDDAFAFTQDQQGGQTARQEDTPQVTDSVVSWETPLFGQTEQMPVKVGETVTVDTTAPAPQMEQSIGKALSRGLEDGAQRLEIRLTPANLGTVTAEFVCSPEGALHVVLRAENPEAAKLLGDHAGALGLLLQDGARSEVRVEVPQPQQNQQSWQQPDQEGGHQQQQQQRHAPRQETESFLHQLRLGLVEAEPEEIM